MQIQLLGHIVEGVSTDPQELEKFTTWPTHRTIKELQQFLGFPGYYRRFIQDFAKTARPLHELTEHKATFKLITNVRQLSISLSTTLLLPQYWPSPTLTSHLSWIQMTVIWVLVRYSPKKIIEAKSKSLLMQADY